MFAETSSRYVTRNPEILSGEPIIIGTRTSVRGIVGRGIVHHHVSDGCRCGN